MDDQEFRKGISKIAFSLPNEAEPFETSVSVVLWNAVELSGFRIVAKGVVRPTVIWTERRPDGTRVVAPPPRSFAWEPVSDAIIEAYEQRRRT